MTQDDPICNLWPNQCTTLWSVILLTKYDRIRAFISKEPFGWPYMTLDPNNAYALSRDTSHQIWYSLLILSKVISSYPSMTFVSRNVLYSDQKFFRLNGGCRLFLGKLTSGRPRLNSVWPLAPAMHYNLARDSSDQIWWPKALSEQIDLCLTPADPYMTVDPICCQGSFDQIWEPHDISMANWPLDDL